MNIAFIVVDCLRSDFLQNDLADTPFLDSLISDGVFYKEMYSTATTTTPCVASAFTGTYSERNGVNSHSEVSLNRNTKTLAEILGDNGYTSYGYPTGPLIEETGLHRGFTEGEYRDRNLNLIGEWGDEMKREAGELSEPFFLFVHLWEIHKPIQPPKKFDSDEYGPNAYARTLSALDRALEEFVDTLPDDTLILIHGDHGESISFRDNLFRRGIMKVRNRLRYKMGLDTRRIERKINKMVYSMADQSYRDHFIEDGHGDTIHDFMSNVPLIANHPSLPDAVVENQVRQVDIFPTILDLLDITYENEIDGKSLLPVNEINDRVAYMRACGTSLGRKNWQRGVRHNGYKHIEYPNTEMDPETYNIPEDEAELTPISDTEVEEILRARMPTDELQKVGEIDNEELLKDLGYL